MSLDKVILNTSKKDFVGFKKYLEAVMEEKIEAKTATKIDAFQKGMFSEKISDKDKEYDVVEPNTHIDDDELDEEFEKKDGDDKDGDDNEKKKAKKKDKVKEEEDADGEDSEDDKED